MSCFCRGSEFGSNTHLVACNSAPGDPTLLTSEGPHTFATCPHKDMYRIKNKISKLFFKKNILTQTDRLWLPDKQKQWVGEGAKRLWALGHVSVEAEKFHTLLSSSLKGKAWYDSVKCWEQSYNIQGPEVTDFS